MTLRPLVVLLLSVAIPVSAGEPPPSEVPAGYLYDKIDDGDEPFVAGCQVVAADAKCTKESYELWGDVCDPDGITIHEWAQPGCHASGKIPSFVKHDCNVLCEKAGQGSGVCAPTGTCGGEPSARCQCSKEPPVPVDAEGGMCEKEPEVCEKLCGDCEDPGLCVENEGVCYDGYAYWTEENDGGDDVFTPSCHTMHLDPKCTDASSLQSGDYCADEFEILELTGGAKCHADMGKDPMCAQLRDCREKCKEAGRGSGVCKTLPGVCKGSNSAQCDCDLEAPVDPT